MHPKFRKGDLVRRKNALTFDPEFNIPGDEFGIILTVKRSMWQKRPWLYSVHWHKKNRATPEFQSELTLATKENENG